MLGWLYVGTIGMAGLCVVLTVVLWIISPLVELVERRQAATRGPRNRPRRPRA